MKIAISGRNDEARKNLIKEVISQWPMYVTPSATIFNEDGTFEKKDFKSYKFPRQMNEAEKAVLRKMGLLYNQYKKYKEEGYIIYDGSTIDVMLNAILLCENDYIRDEVTSTVINMSKEMMRELDVIYWLPAEITENDSKEDGTLELMYENLYNNYQNDFENSPFFNHEDCPTFSILESKDYITEIKLLLDKNGNLGDDRNTGDDLLDIQKLTKVLKNQKLVEAAIKRSKSLFRKYIIIKEKRQIMPLFYS